MPNYSKVYTRTTKQYVYWFERDSIGIELYDPLEVKKIDLHLLMQHLQLHYFIIRKQITLIH